MNDTSSGGSSSSSSSSSSAAGGGRREGAGANVCAEFLSIYVDAHMRTLFRDAPEEEIDAKLTRVRERGAMQTGSMYECVLGGCATKITLMRAPFCPATEVELVGPPSPSRAAASCVACRSSHSSDFCTTRTYLRAITRRTCRSGYWVRRREKRMYRKRLSYVIFSLLLLVAVFPAPSCSLCLPAHQFICSLYPLYRRQDCQRRRRAHDDFQAEDGMRLPVHLQAGASFVCLPATLAVCLPASLPACLCPHAHTYSRRLDMSSLITRHPFV